MTNTNQKENEQATIPKEASEAAHVHGPSCNHGHAHSHHHEALRPIQRTSPKIGRNDPCSCGSQKKFKKCCALK